jgi:type IV secretion system protein VirB2
MIHEARVAKSCMTFHRVAACVLLLALPQTGWPQSSPWETGANSLVTEFLAIATPIAILLVMGLGIAAATGRISWGWPLLVLLGIGIVFGAPQIVAWGRAIFGV